MLEDIRKSPPEARVFWGKVCSQVSLLELTLKSDVFGFCLWRLFTKMRWLARTFKGACYILKCPDRGLAFSLRADPRRCSWNDERRLGRMHATWPRHRPHFLQFSRVQNPCWPCVCAVFDDCESVGRNYQSSLDSLAGVLSLQRISTQKGI